MGRSKKRHEAVTQPADATVEVAIEEYVAHRRGVPHLFDVTRHMDSTAFDPADERPDVGRLAATVRRNGDRHTHVRLLVDDGERYVAMATELAENLRCDVFLTAHNAHLRFVRETSSVTGESWDVIATDRTTGEPAEWLFVRPADLAADVASWFVTARGRLRPSSGLVTVSLPEGLAFATNATFRDTACLAARMRASASRVTTVAVTADVGRFEISRFDEPGSLLNGVEFATLVAASLDVIHPDVKVALTWPRGVVACEALNVELMRLADGLNRTIWVPEPAGAAFVLPGCAEFAAVDEVGGPSTWRPYTSRLAGDWKPQYRTDLDGRLVPLGRVVAARFPGVPFVSVPASQLDQLRAWYGSVAACEGLFALDLAVLDDGRLGVFLDGGRPLAIGARELRVLLREAGWSGEDLLLLAQPPTPYWDAAIDHASHLGDLLKVDIWMPALGAEVWAQPDGSLAADGPDGTQAAWHVVPYGRAGDRGGTDDEGADYGGILVPPALVRAARTTAPGGPGASAAPAAEDGEPEPPPAVEALEPEAAPTAAVAPEPAVEVAVAEVAAVPVSDVDADEALTIEPVAVVLAPAAGGDLSHAVPWLPTSPVVNHRPVDLYLWTSLDTDEIEGWGLPSPDLFLLAGQDALRLADRNRSGCLLRVSAPARTAVDLLEHARHAPAPVQQRLLATGSTHLLPVAWLGELTVTGRFDLDGNGGITGRRDVGTDALAVRFEGADHGVPGLPNEVVNWPDKRLRADAPSYLMLPDPVTSEQRVVDRGFVPLARRRPAFEQGHRLLEVKIRRRRAIDVPATLDKLAGLPVVGRLHDFVGLDVLLSQHDLSKAVVTKVWRHVDGRQQVDKLSGQTLEDVLAEDVRDYAVTR